MPTALMEPQRQLIMCLMLAELHWSLQTNHLLSDSTLVERANVHQPHSGLPVCCLAPPMSSVTEHASICTPHIGKHTDVLCADHHADPACAVHLGSRAAHAGHPVHLQPALHRGHRCGRSHGPGPPARHEHHHQCHELVLVRLPSSASKRTGIAGLGCYYG